jgi:hypothetical protein
MSTQPILSCACPFCLVAELNSINDEQSLELFRQRDVACVSGQLKLYTALSSGGSAAPVQILASSALAAWYGKAKDYPQCRAIASALLDELPQFVWGYERLAAFHLATGDPAGVMALAESMDEALATPFSVTDWLNQVFLLFFSFFFPLIGLLLLTLSFFSLCSTVCPPVSMFSLPQLARQPA